MRRLQWQRIRWMPHIDSTTGCFADVGPYAAHVFGCAREWRWSAARVDRIAINREESVRCGWEIRGVDIEEMHGIATTRRRAMRAARKALVRMDARRALEAMRRERAVTSRRAS